jgi:hypothetical protein
MGVVCGEFVFVRESNYPKYVSLCFLLRKPLKMFLESATTHSIQAGVAEWLSRWPRDPTGIERGLCQKDKAASGPLARRGSNPFPGAVFSKLSGLFSEKRHKLRFSERL